MPSIRYFNHNIKTPALQGSIHKGSGAFIFARTVNLNDLINYYIKKLKFMAGFAMTKARA
jgi:hypothetical protein